MTLTFANTHNMIAYHTKSDASEGFNQIIDFLNGSSIKYALTVNPNIYVSCIKQFWTSVAVKKVNDVIRLQALVDKKNVIITEATIRDALRLDDSEGIECLPNEEILTELARMGYEKPSTKLTFHKAFFSSRKFNFSKYIFDSLVRNMDSSTKFYMYPRFLQLMIRNQVGDLSSYTTKYSSPALTQKHVDEGVAEVHVKDVSTAGVAAEGDVSATNDVVPQPSQDQPLTSQVQLTPPQSPQAQQKSPQHQPQPSHDAGISMDLLQNLLDICTTLTRRVEHLEHDKIAQALEITKLKQRVKKLERRNKASKLKRLKKVGSTQRIDTSDDTVMDDVSKQRRIIADIDADVEVTLKDVVADAKDGQAAEMEENDEVEPAELKELVEVVITAKLITELVTAASATITAAAPQLTTTAAPTLTTAPSDVSATNDVVPTAIEEPSIPSPTPPTPPTPPPQQPHDLISTSQQKAKEDLAVQRYQVMKKRPQIEAQARKNMIMYLKNVVGFRLDYFKGVSYDDIQKFRRIAYEYVFSSGLTKIIPTPKPSLFASLLKYNLHALGVGV
nr:hypothetical protein [Tanacetum cinerariifolium]